MNTHLLCLVNFSLILLTAHVQGGFSYEQLCDETLCNSLGGQCLINTVNTTTNECVCLGVLNCTLTITDCSCSVQHNPCYNGTCLDLEDGGFWCNCTEGWNGVFCDVDKDYCPSNETYYCGHGVCVEGPGTDYYCVCDEEYRGDTCDELFCPESYCSNNGTCSLLTNEQNETYIHCQCLYGYYGSRCERKVARCDEAKCKSLNGTCVTDEVGDCVCLGVSNCHTPITNCSKNEPYEACYNGTCQNEGSSYICDCADGFKGEHCEIDLEFCSNIKCGNGTCIDSIGYDFYCLCNEAYRGNSCDEPFCPQGYCLNGGTCSIQNGIAECSCPVGYTGKKCEIDSSVCTKDTCEGKRVCIEGPGLEYTCICPSGMDCDGNPCEPNPCMNNGTCTKLTDTNFTCNCTLGFGGEHCESDILDSCVELSPCLNGGSCLDRSGKEYECICSAGYDGKNCTNDIEYCHLLKPSLCSQCSENLGNSVTCGLCPRICGCTICSCRPSYCVESQLMDHVTENVTCSHLLKNNTHLVDSVIISCPCHSSLSTSRAPSYTITNIPQSTLSYSPTISYLNSKPTHSTSSCISTPSNGPPFPTLLKLDEVFIVLGLVVALMITLATLLCRVCAIKNCKKKSKVTPMQFTGETTVYSLL